MSYVSGRRPADRVHDNHAPPIQQRYHGHPELLRPRGLGQLRRAIQDEHRGWGLLRIPGFVYGRPYVPQDGGQVI